jgi:hypothetical protein
MGFSSTPSGDFDERCILVSFILHLTRGGSTTVEATAQSIPKRKPRNWIGRAARAAALVAIVAPCAWGAFYLSALRERNQALADLAARGEPTTWEEFADRELSQPSEPNGAALFRKAAQAGARQRNAITGIGLVTIDLNALTNPTIQAELKLARTAFELVDQADRLPPGLVDDLLRTDDPYSLSKVQIAQDARTITSLGYLELSDALGRGDVARAFRSVERSFAAAEQLAKDPFVISQLIRIAMNGVAANQLRVLLAYAAPNDEQFRALDARLAAIERKFTWKAALRTDRAIWLHVLDRPQQIQAMLSEHSRNAIRAGRAAPLTWTGQASEWWGDALARLASSPIAKPNQLRTQAEIVRLYDMALPLLDSPPFSDADGMAKLKSACQAFPLPIRPDGLWPQFEIWHRAGANHRQKIRIARLALAITKYRGEHGRLPSTLSDVGDIASSPWFCNEPPVYERISDGFIIQVPERAILMRESINWRDSHRWEIQFKPLPRPQ